MNRKKIALFLLLAFVSLTGCAREEVKSDDPSIYFLSSHPKDLEKWKAVAQQYTDKTGISVKVEAVEDKDYKSRLGEEMLKENSPSLFELTGDKDYNDWQEYCLNLKDEELYQRLISQDIIIDGKDKGFYGIPYNLGSYGIICNMNIMEQYFQSEGAVRTSIDEIKSFGDLKEVVEDMSSKTRELGIRGVFASTSLAPGTDERWTERLLNVALYYEGQEKDLYNQDFEFQYSENYKNLFDLYINNSGTDPGAMGTKSTQDSVWEFAVGRAAMMQASHSALTAVNKVENSVVKSNRVELLPIYIGVGGEARQGMCTGSEQYLAVNSQASQEDIQATKDFLNWLFTTEDGESLVREQLRFMSPYKSTNDEYNPNSPLAQKVLQDLSNEDTYPVTWSYDVIPQKISNDFGELLISYSKGESSWEEVVNTVRESWNGS